MAEEGAGSVVGCSFGGVLGSLSVLVDRFVWCAATEDRSGGLKKEGGESRFECMFQDVQQMHIGKKSPVLRLVVAANAAVIQLQFPSAGCRTSLTEAIAAFRSNQTVKAEEEEEKKKEVGEVGEKKVLPLQRTWYDVSPDLRQLHHMLVDNGIVSESEFAELHKKERAVIAEGQQDVGVGAVFEAIAAFIDTKTHRLRPITEQMMADIFKHSPVLAAVYKLKVHDKDDEVEFWEAVVRHTLFYSKTFLDSEIARVTKEYAKTPAARRMLLDPSLGGGSSSEIQRSRGNVALAEGLFSKWNEASAVSLAAPPGELEQPVVFGEQVESFIAGVNDDQFGRNVPEGTTIGGKMKELGFAPSVQSASTTTLTRSVAGGGVDEKRSSKRTRSATTIGIADLKDTVTRAPPPQRQHAPSTAPSSPPATAPIRAAAMDLVKLYWIATNKGNTSRARRVPPRLKQLLGGGGSGSKLDPETRRLVDRALEHAAEESKVKKVRTEATDK